MEPATLPPVPQWYDPNFYELHLSMYVVLCPHLRYFVLIFDVMINHYVSIDSN